MTSDPLPNVPSAAEDSAVAVRIASRSGFWRPRPWLRPSSPRRAVQTRLVAVDETSERRSLSAATSLSCSVCSSWVVESRRQSRMLRIGRPREKLRPCHHRRPAQAPLPKTRRQARRHHGLLLSQMESRSLLRTATWGACSTTPRASRSTCSTRRRRAALSATGTVRRPDRRC